MKKQLNITNGDGAGGLLRASDIEGDILVWRDLMFEGPFPEGLDLEATSQCRTAYFDATYLKDDDPAKTFEARDRQLGTASQYAEVTLWFEHDLLDQLQLLQILDWLAGSDLQDTALFLVCIDAYPGIEPFHGLGQLRSDQIAPLLQERVPVSQSQLEIAQSGWAAFRSSDPRALANFLHSDLNALPFLHAALFRHLEEYPSVGSGLGRTDRQILELIASGVEEPGVLFRENVAREDVMFSGDWSFFRHIAALCDGPRPLLHCTPEQSFQHPPIHALPIAQFREQRLTLTKTGKDVLAGKVDAAALRAFDYWLGGVRLQTGRPLWRWNSKTKLLELIPN
jgi:hypothetical protein